MPLSVLLPLVVCGIIGIAVILHLLGLSRPARLEGSARASAVWLREFPDAPPTRVILSHDGQAALIETEAGSGVVWAMGADTTARYLGGARIRRTAKGLRIDLPDFTAPHIRLRLDPDEAAQWPSHMKDSA
ncbi:hypothetical protein ROG8370_00019 [Roseovarius gaetbuli]|uniref:Uncharacterized protein n=1 Tax=Roseovarius gaetbuli TaxID=1356575 RepID=A0A1X6Y333_9RHOB|nr:hypothetical protein [Roseovarius gaetbuli]SLN09572.1 hypothetical protein ROG8370_00019 [Roseovarius gaetbuli]